jgi:tRNA(Ile)-lysidine synthase
MNDPDPATGALATWACVRPLQGRGALAIAYSGGADSTALLHAAVALWPDRVQALHVHHGLQAAADDFERHCVEACRQLGVPLRIGRVDARHGAGESPEDAARRARYLVLANLAIAHGIRHVALAQHADDQVETMLIALGRGAGVDGLAGMPREMKRHGVVFHRPLLDVHADALRAWLKDRAIDFVEDPSNGDERYTRNRIRSRLMPALAETLPGFRETFARSARNAARASALLASVASDDLTVTGTPPLIAALRRLPQERRANVLRHWLRLAGHGVRLKVAQGFVEREGERLRWYNPAPLP